MSKVRVLILAVTCAVFGVASCGEDSEPEAAAPAANPKPKKKKKPKPEKETAAASDASDVAEEPGPPPTYTYSPVGKMDPFRSYLSVLEERNQGDPEDLEPPEPTAVYELGQYRLTTLIVGTSLPRAMVEDPKGEGHVLRVGSRIGKRGGRVRRITRDGILVVEEFRDATGELKRVPITIPLPTDQLGKIISQ